MVIVFAFADAATFPLKAALSSHALGFVYFVETVLTNTNIQHS